MVSLVLYISFLRGLNCHCPYCCWTLLKSLFHHSMNCHAMTPYSMILASLNCCCYYCYCLYYHSLDCVGVVSVWTVVVPVAVAAAVGSWHDDGHSSDDDCVKSLVLSLHCTDWANRGGDLRDEYHDRDDIFRCRSEPKTKFK